MIEDQELREIYQVSGLEHVQNLESGLLKLEETPNDPELLQTLLREAHSLKGDSRVTGVKSVESLAHRLEEILGRLKKGQMGWSESLSDRLFQSLGGLGKLVHEAVTDEPSGVNVNQLLNQLSEFVPSLETVTPDHSPSAASPRTALRRQPLLIEDNALRDTYRISSDEHLSKLQAGLVLLEMHPNDQSSIQSLLHEVQSFEMDSRLVGQKPLEDLIHRIENVFEALQAQQVGFNQVSESLHRGLEAIAALSKEATTGELAAIEPDETMVELDKILANHSHPHAAPGQGGNLDTIRVPMRYLDALMTHTGELTVTKTRMAHATQSIRELTSLWDEWKNGRQRSSGLRLQNTQERLEQIISALSQNLAENNTRLDLIAREFDEKIRTLRLVPLSTIFLPFPRLVRELGKEQGKEIEFVMEGGEIAVDKQILEEMKDPLLHLLRNAVDHGMETPEEREKAGKLPQGKLILKAVQSGSHIIIEVKDDGRGLDLEKIKQVAIKRKLYRAEELAVMGANQIRSLIFTPGFSTRAFITEISGRGVGLDVVRTNVDKLKGNIQVESPAGEGTSFRIQLRSTIATLNVMLFEVAGLLHALPIETIEKTLLIRPGEIYSLEGRATISIGGEPVSLVKLTDYLELPVIEGDKQKKRQRQVDKVTSAILLNIGGDRLAFEVDKLREVLDVVLKPQSKLLKRVRNVIGATILGTGDVCMILNPHDLIKSAQKRLQTATDLATLLPEEEAFTQDKPRILLVEDSIAVRTQEKRVLEKAGYEVDIAVDGLEGYNKLRTSSNYDAIISDVEMPNLDGLGFTLKVRQHSEYRELPIILVTSLASEEDKRRGAQAGANAYIVKDQFNQEMLIETLDRLV
jgi:two-component system chemotaxis sensor kinase CheA